MAPDKMTTRRRVVKMIEVFIVKNKKQPGDALPSEKEFTELLSVSQRAVREALVALDAMGMIEIRPRSGCYVKIPHIPKNNGILTNVWFGQDVSPMEVFQLREVIEREAALKALLHASNNEISAIERMYEKMQSHEAFIGGIEDRNFHAAIVSASGNRIYKKLFEEIWQWGDTYFLWDNFERTTKELNEIRAIHNTILIAIKKRHQKELITALYKHFEITKKNIEMHNIELSQALIEDDRGAEKNNSG